jgi:hypothetical protein
VFGAEWLAAKRRYTAKKEKTVKGGRLALASVLLLVLAATIKILAGEAGRYPFQIATAIGIICGILAIGKNMSLPEEEKKKRPREEQPPSGPSMWDRTLRIEDRETRMRGPKRWWQWWRWW